MSDLPDWLRGMAAPRRNHFFFGKMMGVAQFEQEQRYGLGQRWLINRLTLGAGILCGLEIDRVGGALKIRIKPGVAVDAIGREIVVPVPYDFDPFDVSAHCGVTAAPVETGSYHLCLAYHECASDPLPVQQSADCLGAPDCEHDTTVESFALSLAPIGAETGAPFACDQWLVPRSTGDNETSPPLMADLQAQLASMLKTGCPAPPRHPCVVLGTVIISGNAVKNVEPDGRRYVYSQAQLLDMILCLGEKVAECCGSDPGVPPPVADGTLKVTKLSFWRGPDDTQTIRVVGDTTPSELIEVHPHAPPSDPLVFDAVGHDFGAGLTDRADSASREMLYIRLGFNKPVDGTTLVSLPGQLTHPVGIVVTLRETDSVTGQPVDTPIPVFRLLEDANALLVICPGAPGVYTLTLFGDATGNQPAVRSWDADPLERKRLDGEPRATTIVPSGNDVEGGNFAFSFEIRVAAAKPLPAVETIQFVRANGELVDVAAPPAFNAAELTGFRAVFTAEVAEASLRNDVVMTLDNRTERVDLDFTINGLVVDFGPRAPFVPGDYKVTLTGAGKVARPAVLADRSTVPRPPAGGRPPVGGEVRSEREDLIVTFQVV